MFAKLLKYDNRAVFKYWWIAALSSILIALFGGLCIQIVNVDFTNYAYLQVLAILGIVFVVIGLAVFMLLTEILILIRFYKHFFTDEGYLTFTLPVKKTALLDSKLLSALIFIFVSSIIFIFDIFIMLAVGIPEHVFDPDVWGFIGEFVGNYFSNFGAYGVLYIVLGLLIAIVSTASQMLFIFLCITIAAAITQKHKVLTAIGIYYGANIAVSIITESLSFSGTFTFVELINALNTTTINISAAFVMFGILGIMVAIASGLYLVELYLLDKRLNLE